MSRWWVLVLVLTGCLRTKELFPAVGQVDGGAAVEDAGTLEDAGRLLFAPRAAAVSDDGRYLASIPMTPVTTAVFLTYTIGDWSIRRLDDLSLPATSFGPAPDATCLVTNYCSINGSVSFGTANTALFQTTTRTAQSDYSPGFMVELPSMTVTNLQPMNWLDRIVYVAPDQRSGLVWRQTYLGNLGHFAWLEPLTGASKIITPSCGDPAIFDTQIQGASTLVAYPSCVNGLNSPELRVFTLPGTSSVLIHNSKPTAIHLAGANIVWTVGSLAMPPVMTFVAPIEGGLANALGPGDVQSVSPGARWVVLRMADNSLQRIELSQPDWHMTLPGGVTYRPSAWLDETTFFYVTDTGELFRSVEFNTPVQVVGPSKAIGQFVKVGDELVGIETDSESGNGFPLSFLGQPEFSIMAKNATDAWAFSRTNTRYLGSATFWLWGPTTSLAGDFWPSSQNRGYVPFRMH